MPQHFITVKHAFIYVTVQPRTFSENNNTNLIKCAYQENSNTNVIFFNLGDAILFFIKLTYSKGSYSIILNLKELFS